jgi:hypothetical protein
MNIKSLYFLFLIFYFSLLMPKLSDWIPFKQTEWKQYNPFKSETFKTFLNFINNHKIDIGIGVGLAAYIGYLIKYVWNKKDKPKKKSKEQVRKNDNNSESELPIPAVDQQPKMKGPKNNKFKFKRNNEEENQYQSLEKYRDKNFESLFQARDLLKKVKKQLENSIFNSIEKNYNKPFNNSLGTINESAEMNISISQSIPNNHQIKISHSHESEINKSSNSVEESEKKIDINKPIDLRSSLDDEIEVNTSLDNTIKRKNLDLLKKYYYSDMFFYFKNKEILNDELLKNLLHFIDNNKFDKNTLEIFRDMFLELQNHYSEILEVYAYEAISNNNIYQYDETEKNKNIIEVLTFFSNKHKMKLNQKVYHSPHIENYFNRQNAINKTKDEIKNNLLQQLQNVKNSPILQNILTKKDYLPSSLQLQNS